MNKLDSLSQRRKEFKITKCARCGVEIVKFTSTKYCIECGSAVRLEHAKKQYYKNHEKKKRYNRMYIKKNREALRKKAKEKRDNKKQIELAI